MRRMKAKTLCWRLMERYEAMKKSKGSGRSITATARKVAVIIWHMLTEEVEFEIGKMVDRKLGKKSAGMRESAGAIDDAPIEREEKPYLRKGRKV